MSTTTVLSSAAPREGQPGFIGPLYCLTPTERAVLEAPKRIARAKAERETRRRAALDAFVRDGSTDLGSVKAADLRPGMMADRLVWIDAPRFITDIVVAVEPHPHATESRLITWASGDSGAYLDDTEFHSVAVPGGSSS